MGRAASFLLDRGASIHQRRLKVLSEPCWIVTHHTALKPNLWCIPGEKNFVSFAPYFDEILLPADQAATLLVDKPSFKLLSFGSDKSSPFGRFAQVVFPYLP